MKQRVAALLLITTMSLAWGGCMNRAAQAPIPGAANQFDSDTYLTLTTAKGVIDQTKLDLANNTFPAGWVPNVKKAVNDAVAAYNVADLTYQQYRASAIAGQATPAQQTAVTNAVTNLNTKINSVTSAKAGN